MLVLVVEDEPLVRSCVVAQLEDDGFDVIAAANAEEGLREFEEHAGVTTVFSDINMPGPFDGLSLVHKIFLRCPTVKLILTSGRAPPRKGDMPAGVHFLAKPYNATTLSHLIKAA